MGSVLYAREVSVTGGGWSDVFLADTRHSDQPDIYVAQRGHVHDVRIGRVHDDPRDVTAVLEPGVLPGLPTILALEDLAALSA